MAVPVNTTLVLQPQGVSSAAAYQILHDEAELDGSPSLNFASFVHTWMPDEALKLIVENISKCVDRMQ